MLVLVNCSDNEENDSDDRENEIANDESMSSNKVNASFLKYELTISSCLYDKI